MAGQESARARPPFITVEQDGRTVPVVKGEVSIRRAPFVLILRLPEMTVAKVHVSDSPGVYKLAQTDGPGDDLHPSGGGVAEADHNEDQSLFMSPPEFNTYHVWFSPEGNSHRFDKVEPAPNAIIARRTVATLISRDRARHAIAEFPGNVVYLTSRLVGSASGVEVQRQGIVLRLAGKAAPPRPAPAPQSVSGVAPTRVGGDVRVPAKTKDVAPVYPAVARSARVQGTVMLDVVVATDGSVVDARVVKSIPLLDQAALHAAKEWKFERPMVKGRPAPVIMTAIVRFSLDGDPSGQEPVRGAEGDLAKLKGLLEASGFPTRPTPSGEGFLIQARGSSREWTLLSSLSGDYLVVFTAVGTVDPRSPDVMRALLRLNESVTTSGISLTEKNTVVVYTTTLLRTTDADDLRARIEHLTSVAERSVSALPPARK